MGATTTKGYPYPVGTDRVMDGDNAIQALAEAVDTHLGRTASGQAQVNIVTGGTPVSTAVTFPVGRFNAAPVAVATVQTSAPQNNQASVVSVTASGFTLWMSRTTAGTMTGHWIAALT